MTFMDLMELSVGNLWRAKLRSFLTISGVVIAIAAFVAMLSFGAGNQRHITKLYQDFGLFTSMKVYPKEVSRTEPDSAKAPPLDKEAIKNLSEIPGVVLAFPYMVFEVTAVVADTQVASQARVLPDEATRTKLFSKILAGSRFASDTAAEAIVTHAFADLVGMDPPDSLIGERLVLTTRAPSLDSAVINVIDDESGSIWRRFKAVRFDSLFDPEYRGPIMRRELNEGVRRFVSGFMERQLTISDTLTIVGVGENLGNYDIHVAPIVISERTAQRMSRGAFGFSNDPSDLFAAMQSGRFFSPQGAEESRSYPQVTLETDPYVSASAIKDSVEALGFRAFSYAEQFKEMQRFFLYFNIGLAVIGLIALLTASLGIINTMVMSIVERRREIGVVKSLGADEREIRLMFLVESGTIGAIGAGTGILCGWIGTRIASAIMQAIMEREELPVFELFSLPIWLVAAALVIGIGVSVVAGLYPASRAARVDPVEALRSE